MTFHIAGKNIDLGDALRTHAAERINGAVAKYFGRGSRTHVMLERDGSGFRAECTVHLDSGQTLRTEARAEEARAAFDQAADRVEKRLRRYKRRLRDHSGAAAESLAAVAYVIQAPDSDVEEPVDDNPVIIAEEPTALRAMTVSMAVMEMDLAELQVLVFRNAGHGGMNVVYRRADGNIGWVDPALPNDKKGSAKR